MDSKTKYLIMLFFSTLLSSFGQYFFKFSFISPIFLLFLFVGIVLYAASTIFYLVVLSRAHLSWTYGIGGLSYVFATVFAATLLMENIPLLRWIGVLVIFVGVVLIGSTNHQGTE